MQHYKLKDSDTEVRVFLDTSPRNPREQGTLGRLWCWGDVADNLGDGNKPRIARFRSWEELDFYLDNSRFCLVRLPVYMSAMKFGLSRYQHSAVWGGVRVGVLWVSKKRAMDFYGRQNVTPRLLRMVDGHLEVELNDYSSFITKQVFGYERWDDGRVTKRSGGFYGTDDMDSGLLESAFGESEFKNVVRL